MFPALYSKKEALHMKLPKNAQMRKADSYTINKIGIPGIVLMEKAAEKIEFHISEELEKIGGKTVLFICGKGKQFVNEK